jgi:hypothetical protein
MPLCLIDHGKPESASQALPRIVETAAKAGQLNPMYTLNTDADSRVVLAFLAPPSC